MTQPATIDDYAARVKEALERGRRLVLGPAILDWLVEHDWPFAERIATLPDQTALGATERYLAWLPDRVTVVWTGAVRINDYYEAPLREGRRPPRKKGS